MEFPTVKIRCLLNQKNFKQCCDSHFSGIFFERQTRWKRGSERFHSEVSADLARNRPPTYVCAEKIYTRRVQNDQGLHFAKRERKGSRDRLRSKVFSLGSCNRNYWVPHFSFSTHLKPLDADTNVSADGRDTDNEKTECRLFTTCLQVFLALNKNIECEFSEHDWIWLEPERITRDIEGKAVSQFVIDHSWSISFRRPKHTLDITVTPIFHHVHSELLSDLANLIFNFKCDFNSSIENSVCRLQVRRRNYARLLFYLTQNGLVGFCFWASSSRSYDLSGKCLSKPRAS
jgi:hypothetical protein